MSKYLIKTNDMVYECKDLKSLKSKCNVLKELDIDFDIYFLGSCFNYQFLAPQLKEIFVKYGK